MSWLALQAGGLPRIGDLNGSHFAWFLHKADFGRNDLGAEYSDPMRNLVLLLSLVRASELLSREGLYNRQNLFQSVHYYILFSLELIGKMHCTTLLELLVFVQFAICQTPTSSAQAVPSDVGLSFCYGDSGICEISLDLLDVCGGILSYENQTACYCASGWYAATEACDACMEAYAPELASNLINNYTAQCQSVGATLLPIPSSASSVWAVHNASWADFLANGTFPPATGTVSTRPTLNTTLFAPSNTLPSVTATRGAIPSATVASGASRLQVYRLSVVLLTMFFACFFL